MSEADLTEEDRLPAVVFVRVASVTGLSPPRQDSPVSACSAASSAVPSARSWMSAGTWPSSVSSTSTAECRSPASPARSQARLSSPGNPASGSASRSGLKVPAALPSRLGRRLTRFLALISRRVSPRSEGALMTRLRR
ncbi:hypothetical protein NKH18_02155 [Streptomyces sp. M10(2022)]